MAYSRARAGAELAARQARPTPSPPRERAIAAYEEAAKTFDRRNDPELYVQIQRELGILRLQNAMTRPGVDAVNPAKAAAEAFSRALSVATREADPDLWAASRAASAPPSCEAGKSTPPIDASAVSLLEAAALAFGNLLGVLRAERSRDLGADPAHNLGTTYRELGFRQPDDNGFEALRQSISARKSALEVPAREKDEGPGPKPELNLVLSLRELARRLDPEAASRPGRRGRLRMEEARPVLEQLGKAVLPASDAGALAPPRRRRRLLPAGTRRGGSVHRGCVGFRPLTACRPFRY